jgi:uncharacterized integral membrane protein
MYYVQKIVQLILLIAVIVLGIENFNITETGMSLLFLVDLPPTSVVFVVLASLLAGVIIMAFFSFVKDWRTVRENRIKISRLKNTVKDLELKSKDLQIVQNELEKLKIDHITALSEVKTLKEVLSAQKTGTGNQVEY